MGGKLIIQEQNQPQAACQSLPADQAHRLIAVFQTEEHPGENFSLTGKAALPISMEDRKLVLGRQPQKWWVLAGRSDPLGLLVLGSRRGAEFEPHDLEILEVVVRQAKAALENSRLLEEIRQRSEHINRLHRQLIASREEERKRVARDLHDQTVQALVGLNYQLARAKNLENANLEAELSSLQSEVQRILRDVRQVCSDLRPPGLDLMGLVPAMRSRLALLSLQDGLQVEFTAVESLELGEESSLCLYRVFQEALINVQKHARASWVSIRLEQEAGWAVLVVEDNGRGFSLPARLEEFSQKQHFGFVGLKEQLDAAGGRLEIDSAPEEGCKLTARLPLEARPEEEQS
jgi:signal transduction histidine kinase